MIPTPDTGALAPATRSGRGRWRYRVFGGVLESALPLPGLRPARARDRDPDWTFGIERRAVGAGARPGSDGVLLGSERLVPGLGVELYAAPDGAYRLHYTGRGIGEFRISADGRRIAWCPGEDPPLAHLRWILFGRVMALALHRAGFHTLHASAVATGEGVICFVGPKHAGKSTLAAACIAAGARPVADDLVPLEPAGDARAYAWPGVPAVRLWPDAAARFGARARPGEPKAVIDAWPGHARLRSRAPVAAIYLLRPTPSGGGAADPVAATRLSPRLAFEALVRHCTVAPLVGASGAAELFTRSAAVARAVPVHVLGVARALERVGEVADWLLARHGRPAAARGRQHA